MASSAAISRSVLAVSLANGAASIPFASGSFAASSCSALRRRKTQISDEGKAASATALRIGRSRHRRRPPSSLPPTPVPPAHNKPSY